MGKNSGQRWLTVLFLNASQAAGVAPPASGTCCKADTFALGAKAMIPWLLQLAAVRVRVCIAEEQCSLPRLLEIFFSLPPAKNPIHWPSGEKKGA